ncbi:hypothetical protein AVEN_75618-1 [Araneus ventricosus]|uniref:Uncharacterized protein n=1 Tax=Araneus ventricosus TaxID=182803 RepID=A0A4Y2CJW9_ARAVE|nr:hypothetical protein AVEN_75618-1 [Araneus ventricosus]
MGRRLTLDVRFNVYQVHIHNGYFVEPGFVSVTSRSQSRNLTTRPPIMGSSTYICTAIKRATSKPPRFMNCPVQQDNTRAGCRL